VVEADKQRNRRVTVKVSPLPQGPAARP